MEANKTQVGGTHYQSIYQHWDFAAISFGSGYFKGVITKYVTRWKKKNGMEDLQKARHYLVKLIELVDKGMFNIPFAIDDSANFAAANALDLYEAAIVSGVTAARTVPELEKVMVLLDELMQNEGSRSGAVHHTETKGA